MKWDELDDGWKKVFEDKKKKKLTSITDVYIDEEADVTSLDLLATLPKITEVNCDAKKVTDLSPLAKLPKLKSLRISSPIRDFSPIAKMTKLESLELSDTELADLAPVASLAKLERLDISGTKVTSLAPLAKLKKLERLEVNRTAVRDLSPIAGLKKSLRDLEIAGTPVEEFSPLAKLSLHSLDASETGIATLEPIWEQREIHILVVRKTKLGFEQILRYASHRSEEEQDPMLGLSLYSDFQDSDAFIAAVKAIDFPLAGLEAAITGWMNNVLVAFVKNEENAPRAPALIELFLSLRVAPNKYTKEMAGNALHVAVTQTLAPELERAIVETLVPQSEMDRRLAYNLACYHARRGNRAELLRFAKIALEKGQEAERFRTDPDFESVRNDTDFEALVAAPHAPDPYVDPLGWWKSLPDELRQCMPLWDEATEESIGALLEADLELQLSDVRSLDPLRGMKVKSLRMSFCKPSSLEIVGTLRGLELLEWSTNEYSPDTKMKDLSPLAKCLSLRELDLSGHAISDLAPLADLVKLERLRLRGCPVGSLEPLRGLVELKHLQVDAIEPLDLEALAHTKLETLWLHGPVKSFEPIAKLKSLQRFWMQKLVLEGGSAPSLEPLRALAKLQQLWVGDARKKEAKKLLPKCEVA